ncbi:hypothetical protein DTL42_07525 [Bremerella cremea]|uniref:Uncharacterized protein n=1 Tax=Bremerella cremea TaxID=1031537 RepID=A0A368KVC8_9BACT|nr:hypothetical protein DTL42_07525 [Bremerella cremea]
MIAVNFCFLITKLQIEKGTNESIGTSDVVGLREIHLGAKKPIAGRRRMQKGPKLEVWGL